MSTENLTNQEAVKKIEDAKKEKENVHETIIKEQEKIKKDLDAYVLNEVNKYQKELESKQLEQIEKNKIEIEAGMQEIENKYQSNKENWIEQMLMHICK